MTLGLKIVELRKKEGLTQEELAEKLKISRQTLSSWESDNTSPDLKQAGEIASIFRVSLDDLMDHKLEMEFKVQSSILKKLVGKVCYIDLETNDYLTYSTTLCKILEVQNEYIKIEYPYDAKEKKKKIKLLDKNLIISVKEQVEEGDK